MELSEKLEVLYPSVSEEVVDIVIESAKDYIFTYCNILEVPESLNGTLLQMCKEDLNRIGSEGLTSESAGGSAVGYNSDYSDTVYKALNKHRRIRFL